jgi:hypothetical protein
MVKFPLTDEDATRLYDAGKPSPYGRGGETVIDETYRQAHEIRVKTDHGGPSVGNQPLMKKKLECALPCSRLTLLSATT